MLQTLVLPRHPAAGIGGSPESAMSVAANTTNGNGRARWKAAQLVSDIASWAEVAAVLSCGLASAWIMLSGGGFQPEAEALLGSEGLVAATAALAVRMSLPPPSRQTNPAPGPGGSSAAGLPFARLQSLRATPVGAAAVTAGMCIGCGLAAALVMSAVLTTTAGIGLWLALACVSIGTIRISALALTAFLTRRGLTGEFIAVIASHDDAARIERVLGGQTAQNRSFRVFPLPERPGAGSGPLHEWTRLVATEVLSTFPDRVIIAQDGISARAVPGLLARLGSQDLQVDLAVRVPAGRPEQPSTDSPADGVLLARLVERSFEGWPLVAKVVLDKVIAAALLVFLSPLLLLVALAVRAETPGPIIFRQQRHGWNHTEFELLKFRTMVWQGCAAGNGSAQTRRNDRRVTRVGQILRRLSIDELPQLINVLRGEMSLVGPRPHPVAMRTCGQIGEDMIPEYHHRLRARPGLTGLAQVRGWRGGVDCEYHLRQRIASDLTYIGHWSVPLDLAILVMTPLKLLFCDDNAF